MIGRYRRLLQDLLLLVVVAVLLGTSACGITGPKLHFAPTAPDSVAGTGPGISGSVTDSSGVTMATGSVTVNPAVLFESLYSSVSTVWGKKVAPVGQ